MAEKFILGTKATVTCSFKVAGVLTNPSSVQVRVLNPDGIETTPTPGLISTGIWGVDVVLDVEGEWQVRFQGTGAVQVAAETTLVVRQTVFA